MTPLLSVLSVPPLIVPIDIDGSAVGGDDAPGLVGDRVEELEHPAAGRFERSGVGDAAVALVDVEVLTRCVGVDRRLVDDRQRTRCRRYCPRPGSCRWYWSASRRCRAGTRCRSLEDIVTMPPPDSVTALPRLTIALLAAPLIAKVPSLTMAPSNCVVEPVAAV